MRSVCTGILLIFIVACSDEGHSYEATQRRTATQAAELAEKNQRFELGRFIHGRWRGVCDPESISELVFEDGRVWKISYHEGLEGGAAFGHGLYEVVSEDTIVFHRMSLDSIQIKKTSENSFTIPENGSPMIYYGCTFTR